jgi:4-hydroxy-tetrahydrodipicolinate synthase
VIYQEASGLPIFGRVLTAMITPFNQDLTLDRVGTKELASYLVGRGNDGLVVNGTTGESSTVQDDEKTQVVADVVSAVGDRACVVAGVGSNDTAHSVHLAKEAHAAGADALMVVTPYYNKPQQAGVIAHILAIADATPLPVMTYDIPGRSCIPITHDSFLTLAKHPKVIANKDAKADLVAASEVMQETDLIWYSGDDGLTLPLMSLGAVGVVSVVGHIASESIAEMAKAASNGDYGRARTLNDQLIPIVRAVMTRMPGAVAVKAVMTAMGLPAGPLRLPLVSPTPSEQARLFDELKAAGVSW